MKNHSLDEQGPSTTKVTLHSAFEWTISKGDKSDLGVLEKKDMPKVYSSSSIGNGDCSKAMKR